MTGNTGNFLKYGLSVHNKQKVPGQARSKVKVQEDGIDDPNKVKVNNTLPGIQCRTVHSHLHSIPCSVSHSYLCNRADGNTSSVDTKIRLVHPARRCTRPGLTEVRRTGRRLFFLGQQAPSPGKRHAVPVQPCRRVAVFCTSPCALSLRQEARQAADTKRKRRPSKGRWAKKNRTKRNISIHTEYRYTRRETRANERKVRQDETRQQKTAQAAQTAQTAQTSAGFTRQRTNE